MYLLNNILKDLFKIRLYINFEFIVNNFLRFIKGDFEYIFFYSVF